MKIVAIDPGITGALAVLVDGSPTHVTDMPTVKEGSKTVIDLDLIAAFLWEHRPDSAVIEQVGGSPRMGVSGAFNFGGSFMGVRGVCAGVGVPCDTITPQKWKTLMGLSGKEKDATRLKMIESFPHLAKELKRKKDCDRADAIGIGLGWLILKKVTKK